MRVQRRWILESSLHSTRPFCQDPRHQDRVYPGCAHQRIHRQDKLNIEQENSQIQKTSICALVCSKYVDVGDKVRVADEELCDVVV